MEENQNGQYGGDAPRTYGEESRMYENRQNQQSQQNQQNPYGNYQQNQQSQQNPYGGGYQQNWQNQQNPYGGGYQQNWQNQQNPYGYTGNMHGQVTDVFCNILLVIMVLRVILAIFMIAPTYAQMEAMWGGGSMRSAAGGVSSALSLLSSLLFIAYVVFAAIDIVKLQRANYKIVGLVLFAFFLNAGYYIWRAYILGRKKTGPILFTVFYSLLLLVNVIYSVYEAVNLTFSHMQMFY